jgi:signal transduction histidine kinase/CheY-like chemotaxis protein
MARVIPKTSPAAAESLDKALEKEPTSLHHRLILWLAAHAGELSVESSWLGRYATALGALGSATLARWLLDPYLENRAPYGMYLMAVVIVAWRAGLGPALVTVFGGILLGRFFFDPPRWTLWMVTESNEVAMLMSLTIGLVSAFVCESLRVTARDYRRLFELAKQADARKDEFLATLAHELRNPLMPIRNATFLLDRIELQEPRVVELHQMIGRHTEHLIRLVNDLLEISRITQRKVELRREQVDLQAIVDDAVEAVRPLLTEKRQNLSISLPQSKVFLHADSLRLTQVLTNLLHNAAKYTGKDGRIWLSAETNGEEVVLRVRDTGIGIPKEMCEQIFDLFAQVQHGIEHSYGGLGIGLTLVRALGDLHGGTVEARSPGLELGSEFIVRLPTMQIAEVAPPSLSMTEEEDAIHARDGSLRILIVEDSPAIAATLEMILLEWHHEVRVCSDGFAALETARAFKPDVVLADLGMPRMNGYQLAEELRQIPALRETALIAVSGYGQQTDRQRSQAAGFERHLVKPVNLVELKQILTEHLARTAAGATAAQTSG